MFLSYALFTLFSVSVAESGKIQLTTVAPQCVYYGKTYPPGDFRPSPCKSCRCESSGQHWCIMAECFFVPCVNPVHHADECCPTCPDGNNCRHGNITIPEGKTVQIDPVTSCHCKIPGRDAVCAIRVTKPPGCMYEGKMYQFGSFSPSPCRHCQCDHSGRAYCAVVDCSFSECVDAQHRNDTCCPVCPNGPNCYAGNKIIAAGKDVQVDSHTTCRCPSPSDGLHFGFGHPTAICRSTLVPATSIPVVVN